MATLKGTCMNSDSQRRILRWPTLLWIVGGITVLALLTVGCARDCPPHLDKGLLQESSTSQDFDAEVLNQDPNG